MSDFFTHLAERALGKAILARPVVAPYAWNAPASEMMPPAPEDALATGSSPSAAEGGRTPPPLTAGEEHGENRNSHPPLEGPTSPASLRPPLFEARQKYTPWQEAALPAPGESVPSSGQREAPPLAAQASPPAELPAPSGATGFPEERAINMAMRKPPPAESFVAGEEKHSAAPLIAGVPPTAKPLRVEVEVPPAKASPPQATPVPLLVPAAMPPLSPQSAPLPAAGLPPPETVIHIHIGRVEIRAAPTAALAPERPARRPTTVVTLEEYLKQRNEERR